MQAKQRRSQPGHLAAQDHQLTDGLSSHSVRQGAAAYANASPKLAFHWNSTRGAWLLDSLIKAFAYVGTTTREDQSVGKVLAKFRDPDLPCTTPNIRPLKERIPETEYAQVLAFRNQLFRNVTGFDDTALNVAPDVLDAALAYLLIHLQDVCDAVAQKRNERNFTTYYYYRVHEAISSTNATLGTSVSIKTCHGWGSTLMSGWKSANFAQTGVASGGDSSVMAAAITQILASINRIENRVAQLGAAQSARESSVGTLSVGTTTSSSSTEVQPRLSEVQPRLSTPTLLSSPRRFPDASSTGSTLSSGTQHKTSVNSFSDRTRRHA